MDISYIMNQYITPSVVALIGSAAILWLAWSCRSALASFVATLQKKLFTRSGFFWTVTLIFMAVSVLHAGAFFGITGNGHDIPGVAQYLGFAVSFFLDLVTIILMQAMLEAKYRSEEQKARQLLLFIIICCGTSTFANLAISLNDFDASTMLPYAPLWIQFLAPYVLASFPLFVILMSIAAEMIVNVRPLDSLNAEEYEADEQKRVRLMQIRNDYLQRQADEELRALQIRNQMKLNKKSSGGSMPKSFRWPWEKAVDVDAIIAGVTEQLKAVYEPEIESLNQQLQQSKSDSDYASQIALRTAGEGSAMSSEIERLRTAHEAQIEALNEQLKEVKKQQSVQEQRLHSAQNSADPKVQKDGETRARSALQKDPNLTAKQLAQKAEISESYAQKLKAQIAKEGTPKPRNTDELPVTNGHRKVTQPLANLVPLKV